MQTKDVVELVATAPSADNCQPWQFIETQEGMCCQYRNRATKRDPFGALGHGTLMAAGSLLANFDSLRPTNGDKPEVTLGASGWNIAVNLSTWNSSIDPAVARLLLARHTNRHPFVGLPSQPTGAICQSNSARSLLLTSPESIKALSKALFDCSIVRFNNQELHEWLFSSLRWTPAEVDSGTGLDVETLHLPPGGRWFMKWIAPWERMRILNKLGINQVLAAADGALFSHSSGVIAFVGGQGPQDILEAGQLMQRTWLALNSQGIAVHPYYVLTDLTNRLRQKKLDSRWAYKVSGAHAIAADIFQLLPDEQVHMLFRIGLPTITPIKSRRLPLSSLLAG